MNKDQNKIQPTLKRKRPKTDCINVQVKRRKEFAESQIESCLDSNLDNMVAKEEKTTVIPFDHDMFIPRKPKRKLNDAFEIKDDKYLHKHKKANLNSSPPSTKDTSPEKTVIHASTTTEELDHTNKISQEINDNNVPQVLKQDMLVTFTPEKVDKIEQNDQINDTTSHKMPNKPRQPSMDDAMHESSDSPVIVATEEPVAPVNNLFGAEFKFGESAPAFNFGSKQPDNRKPFQFGSAPALELQAQPAFSFSGTSSIPNEIPQITTESQSFIAASPPSFIGQQSFAPVPQSTFTPAPQFTFNAPMATNSNEMAIEPPAPTLSFNSIPTIQVDQPTPVNMQGGNLFSSQSMNPSIFGAPQSNSNLPKQRPKITRKRAF